MASEFQRRKVAGVFHAMDADGNGYLEESDFEALTGRWVGIRGWEPGTADYERMRAIMMGWWSARTHPPSGSSARTDVAPPATDG